VPVDQDGMVVDQLTETWHRVERPPRLIYANPNFQNPTGVTLSLGWACPVRVDTSS